MPLYNDYTLFQPNWAKVNRGYDHYDALSLALVCDLAYQTTEHDHPAATDKQGIERQLQQWHFDTVDHFDVSNDYDVDTQGFIATNRERILICFRGTDSTEDWRANIQSTQVDGPFPSTKVHHGFFNTYLHASLDIGRLIERYFNDDKEIWITGHSFGGAQAVLLCAQLLSRGIHTTGLYTFGSPRVGCRNFKRNFESAHTGVHARIINAHDLVPHVPLEMNYSHVGKRRILSDTAPSSESSQLWSDLKGNMWGWIGKIVGDDSAFTVSDAHRLHTHKGYIYQIRKELGLL